MPINLVKGQNHVLNMNIFHVGLGWDVNEDASSDDDFDLDVSAFMVPIKSQRTITWFFIILKNG